MTVVRLQQLVRRAGPEVQVSLPEALQVVAPLSGAPLCSTIPR